MYVDVESLVGAIERLATNGSARTRACDAVSIRKTASLSNTQPVFGGRRLGSRLPLR